MERYPTFDEARKTLALQQEYASINEDLEIARITTLKAKNDALASEKAISEVSSYQRKATYAFDKYVSLVNEAIIQGKRTDDLDLKVYEVHVSFIFKPEYGYCCL